MQLARQYELYNYSPTKAMTDKEFSRLSSLIHDQCGINMPAAKKEMLEARLLKRLRKLGMHSYAAYCDYLFSNEGLKNELIQMIDVVTTNKTAFFREPAHFDYLLNTALPELVRTKGAGIGKRLIIWSAGCSSGEEPYTLAMLLREFGKDHPGFQFLVLATDISTRVLDKARLGIYDADQTEPIPARLKQLYLMRSKDRREELVRIVPELRDLVRFGRLNFMDDNFGLQEPIDIIFCRNVIIYFDKPTQKKLLTRFCEHLLPGGYLFMGHSETLNDLNLPLSAAHPAVYRKPQ